MNVDEDKSKDEEFDSYWDNLQWGKPHKIKSNKSLGKLTERSFPEHIESKELTFERYESIHPDVEFIDPSKASRLLSNLQFMRIRQKIDGNN